MPDIISLADKLRMTTAGKQSALNADQGGVWVVPKSFAVGTFTGSVPSTVPDDLLTSPLYGGNIHYAEVVSEQSVRFTFDIPTSVGTEAGIPIGEVVIYLDDGTAFAHAVLAEPYVKRKGIGVRIEAMLHILEAPAAVINVTLSELGSIPSVANVEALPSPVTSLSNAISVLDLVQNVDGSTSPGVVCKYGNGGQHWGFYGYSRIFSEALGIGNAVSPAELNQSTAITEFELQNGDEFIIQVISGNGAGETRLFKLNGSDENASFVAVGSAFTALSDNSVVSIWAPIGASGSSGCAWPPQADGVPTDWVLTKGEDSCPVWSPPYKNKAQSITLYREPSKLELKPFNTMATSDRMTYDIGDVFPENNNFALVNTQGINQHRNAFDVVENRIEFSQRLVNQIILDIRTFTRAPSSGTKLIWHTGEHTGNGSTQEFDMPSYIDSPELAIITVDHAQQALTSYTLDKDRSKIIFTEAPPAGSVIQIRTVEYIQEEGFSTDIVSVSMKTSDLTNVILLPISPESKDQVFVSEQGFWVHASSYEVVDNRVIFNGSIEPETSMEVLVFQNIRAEGVASADVKGMVVGAVATAKGIELIRHNAPSIKLPAPEFTIKSGSGTRVTGQYPEFLIESTLAEQIAKDSFNSFNVQAKEEDAEQILITQRIEFKGDIIVQANADLMAELGPGFISESGYERGQFVLGVRTTGTVEPEYGRGIKGTGEFGIKAVSETQAQASGYGNASVTQSWNIIKANHPAGYIDIVAKMRISDANISKYGSKLTALLNIVVLPQLGS